MRNAFAAALCFSTCLAGQFIQADDEAPPRILIVTNDGEDKSHAFIEKALAPSRRDAEFDVTVAQAEYLAEQPLDGFTTIFLNDVARLSDVQHTALKKIVKAGVGLCILIGPNAEIAHYNRTLYADGKGLFPLPLGQPTKMPEGKTGITPAKHPLLRVFEGDAKPMLDIVLVTKCHIPAADWNPADEKALSVIAHSNNGNPIAVSKPYGDGSVVVLLFVADRRWANWHFYPAWVVMLHEMQTFLTEY